MHVTQAGVKKRYRLLPRSYPQRCRYKLFRLRDVTFALGLFPDRSWKREHRQEKIGLVSKPLSAMHSCSDMILVLGEDSSTGNVMGGLRLAPYVFGLSTITRSINVSSVRIGLRAIEALLHCPRVAVLQTLTLRSCCARSSAQRH
jgi:hypothetical protein